MNGELVHAIALATHGTLWLRQRRAGEPASDVSGSTSAFVRSLSFVDRGLLRPRRVAGAGAWLEGLHRNGVDRLWLMTGDDMSGWRLLATGARARAHWWDGEWTIGTEGPADRIWDVVYRSSRAPRATIAPQPPLVAAEAELEASLEAVRRFASDRDLSPWTEQFTEAIHTLAVSGGANDNGLLPTGFPARARRLATAASQGFVFGGMGSWNDLGFIDDAENATYRELSRRLHGAVMTSLVSAVNVDIDGPST